MIAREFVLRAQRTLELTDGELAESRLRAQPGEVVGMRPYGDLLTADINRKGVLDVDVVKGCTSGIAAHGEKGCYQACYAANVARYLGINFSRAVVRKVYSMSQAKIIERTVKAAPLGFFRVGTMGDPCHAWAETVETIEWLAPYAIPVIITKHWRRASDDQLRRLMQCGTIINTSISALDSAAHLARRITEIQRYAAMGGTSIPRVVSCDFNSDDPIGAAMDRVQRRLFAMRPMIDNPLRLPASHHLVVSGIVRARKVKDLTTVRTISVSTESTTYLGHCTGCSDLCGAGLLATPDERPASNQYNLFNGDAANDCSATV